jgi:hypothetical protein
MATYLLKNISYTLHDHIMMFMELYHWTTIWVS